MLWHSSWKYLEGVWGKCRWVFSFVCSRELSLSSIETIFTQIFLDQANMWFWKYFWNIFENNFGSRKYVILKRPFQKVPQNLFLLLLTSLSFKPSLACDNSYYVNTHTQVFIENKYIPMPDLTQSIWYLIDPRLFR